MSSGRGSVVAEDDYLFTDDASAWALPQATPHADEEEPPEPAGHALTEGVRERLGGTSFFEGLLPHDLAAIWGHPPATVDNEATARILINAWGIEEFRISRLHQGALREAARSASSREVTTRFKAEREKEKRRRTR